MNIILDLTVIIIMFVCIVIGYKRGFVKTVFNFVGGIISFLAASILSGPVSDFINSKFILPAFKKIFIEKLSTTLDSAADKIDLNGLLQDKPSFFIELLNKFNINQESAEAYFNSIADATPEGKLDKFAEYVVSPVSSLISFIIAFIVIIIVAKIVIDIVAKITDLIAKFPLIRVSNKLLGLAAGLVFGVLAVFIFCSLAEFILPYTKELDNYFFKDIDAEKTTAFKYFSSINPLKDFISFFI